MMHIDFSQEDKKSFWEDFTTTARIIFKENFNDDFVGSFVHRASKVLPQKLHETIFGSYLLRQEREIHIENLEMYGRGFREVLSELLRVSDHAKHILAKDKSLNQETRFRLERIVDIARQEINKKYDTSEGEITL